jgi:hypothetical protein
MHENEFDVVTGMFGYSGKYITRRLLEQGHIVCTLTNSINCPNPFGPQVQAFPYSCDNLEKLTDSLRGTSVLCNTYWVRFDHQNFSLEVGIENGLCLFSAAR